MPRSSPSRTARSGRPPRREAFLAVSERVGPDGTREALRVTPEAIVLVRERDGKQVAEEIPLKELARIRTRDRVRRVELLVALSYLLGASIFLYLIVNLLGRLADGPLWLVLAVLTFFAAGGVAAAWFGQEAVVQFVSRGRAKRIEYVVRPGERERLAALEALGDLQREA